MKRLIIIILSGLFLNFLNAQNGTIGSGFGTNDWSTTDCWNGGAGSSRIWITTANGTGNQYFRLVTCWDGNWNQWGTSSTTEDYQVSIGVPVEGSTSICQNCATKAYYINVSSTSDNYVFKTRSGGNPPSNPAFVVFRIQGNIASVSSVSQDPAAVIPSENVTITANLNSSLNTGQGVYLRYTTDNWSNSTIIEMTGSGTSYSAQIPASANIKDQLVQYYVFTSGNGLAISHSDADFFTINLNNNGGSNFSYIPRAIEWVNLQFPEEGTMMPGDDFNIYAQVYINGITTQSSPSSYLSAWIGFSTTNTDPSTWNESAWKPASFNSKSGNNHEYVYNAKNAGLSPGTYYYASRFKYGNSDYFFGGYNGGEWDGTNNISGVIRFGKNSVQTGNWEDNTTWDNNVPVLGEHVFIKNGHTVTINSDITVNSITIESGGTLIVNGTKTITIGPNGSFKNNGTFTGMQSTIVLNGTSIIEGSSETEFNNITVEGLDVTILYTTAKVNGILDLKAGSIYNAPEFRVGSTLKYSQGGNYNRVTEWNNPWNVQVSNNTILNLNINAFNNNLSLGGNLIIDSGSEVIFDNGHTFDLIVGGDIVLNGTLSLSSTSGSDLFVGGNWTRTGTFNPNGRMVEFNSTLGIKTLIGHTTFDYIKINNTNSELKLNDGITINNTLWVENGACLNLSTQIVDGNGGFELVNEGILKIGHPDGITTSESTGNIRVTGTRNYGNSATYHYIGNSNQYSGNALPTAHEAKNLIIELSDDTYEFRINTSSAVEIAAGGKLEIRSGKLIEAATPSQGRQVQGAGDLVMSGGEYIFESTVSESSTIRFPRLTGNQTNISGGTITLAGTSQYQHLRPNVKYYNIKFSGSGIKTIPNYTADINGTVTIENNAIVDSKNFIFGKEITNLTISSGRLIIAGTGTKPDMEGTYNITGGTIEFSNNNITTQTIRGTASRNYFNIEVTGNNVANSSGDIYVTGTFAIKNGGKFSIASTYKVRSTGNFIVEDGGSLFYGAADGITQSTNIGNITVTGSRTYSSNASYGFIGGVNQVPGDGLPSSFINLTVDKNNSTNTITLGQNYFVNGTLQLNNGIVVTGSNTLIINNSSNSSIVAGTGNTNFVNSYVAGNLSRVVSNQSDFYFPVGTTSNAQLVELDFSNLNSLSTPSVTANFTADSGEDISSLGLYIDGTILTNRLNNGYWTLTPSNIDNLSADITLYGRGYSGASPNPFAYAIIKRNGGNWFIPDGTHSNTTQSISGGTVTVKRSAITSFSDWAISFNNQDETLPVNLVSFSANRVSPSKIEIVWTSASELNNDYYILQKSFTPNFFKDLAIIPGAGNSNQTINYKHIDSDYERKTIYYRLKQVDFDGSYSYSKIISVNPGDNELEIIAYYKFNKIFMNNLPTENSAYNIYIYNSLGQVLENFNVFSDYNNLEINKYLPEGIYFLLIKNQNFEKIIKINVIN
jgi:hypothetical protein